MLPTLGRGVRRSKAEKALFGLRARLQLSSLGTAVCGGSKSPERHPAESAGRGPCEQSWQLPRPLYLFHTRSSDASSDRIPVAEERAPSERNSDW